MGSTNVTNFLQMSHSDEFPNFHLKGLQRKDHSKQKNANLVTNSNRLIKTQIYSILSENKARKKHVIDYKLDEFIKIDPPPKKNPQKLSVCALFLISSYSYFK